jgi:hypothetical protein
MSFPEIIKSVKSENESNAYHPIGQQYRAIFAPLAKYLLIYLANQRTLFLILSKIPAMMVRLPACFFGWLIAAFPVALSGQQVILPSGGDHTGTAGSVSISVGQVFFSADSTAEGSMHEGVQHAFEWYPVSVADESLAAAVQVFPNPTAGWITIELDRDIARERVFCLISDAFGKAVSNTLLDAESVRMDVHHLPSGWYLVQIMQNQKVIQTYKIIKL